MSTNNPAQLAALEVGQGGLRPPPSPDLAGETLIFMSSLILALGIRSWDLLFLAAGGVESYICFHAGPWRGVEKEGQ